MCSHSSFECLFLVGRDAGREWWSSEWRRGGKERREGRISTFTIFISFLFFNINLTKSYNFVDMNIHVQNYTSHNYIVNWAYDQTMGNMASWQPTRVLWIKETSRLMGFSVLIHTNQVLSWCSGNYPGSWIASSKEHQEDILWRWSQLVPDCPKCISSDLVTLT